MMAGGSSRGNANLLVPKFVLASIAGDHRLRLHIQLYLLTKVLDKSRAAITKILSMTVCYIRLTRKVESFPVGKTLFLY